MNSATSYPTPLPSQTDESYLQLQLARQTRAVLPLQAARKVLVIPKTKVTPIPNMPECFLGLFSQRSQVFWAVDLLKILDLRPSEMPPRDYSVVVINSGEITLGLVVQEVRGVLRLATNSIQSPSGMVAPRLGPYLQGCLLEQGEVLLVLNVQAIARSPALYSVPPPV
ncbi:MAG: chemotaxis protein CheW [Cyanophyceae cyanobacterium]